MRSKKLMTIRPPRRALASGAAAVLILVALLVAGCGGSSGGSSSSEESSTTTSGGQGAPGGFEISEEAQACLKEKGVELPEGGEPPAGFEGKAPPRGGAPPEGFEGGEPPEGFGGGEMGKAFEECGVEVPQGKAGGPNLNSAAFKKQIKEYVACVRENGYDLPEPNLSGEGPVLDESEVDQEDPKFKEASEACQSKLSPQGTGGESG